MKNILKYLGYGVFGGIGFVGLIAMVFFVIVKTLPLLRIENSPFHVAQGNNYLFVTLSFIGIFIFWQYRSLKNDFNSPNNVVSLISLISFILGGIGFAGNILKYWGITWFSNIIFKTIGFFTSDIGMQIGAGSPDSYDNFFSALMGSFMAGGAIWGLVCAILFLLLRVGIFTSGLAFSIGLHNYFNGMGFDFSIFWNLVLETSLSDFWGTVLTISQLALTLIISKFYAN